MVKALKLVFKIVGKVLSLGGTGLLLYIVWVINPFNMPTIFKRNYPEAFERFPLKLISPFISLKP